MITIILNLINKVMEGILISELKEKKIIDGSETIPVESKNQNYNINVNNLKNFINDIEITDYNLLFDTYENKVWQNGVIVHDGILQRNCTSIVPLDRNNNIYTNTSGNTDVVFFDKDGKYISTLNFYNNNPVLKENFPENAELVAFTYYRDSIMTDSMISGEVVLPNTPTVTGYASYSSCDCHNNSTQTPAA